MPITMRTGIILENDDGDYAWAPSSHRLREVAFEGQDRLFYRFVGDAKFASFLGYEQSPHAFNKNVLVRALKRLRNEAVTKLMQEVHVADPEAAAGSDGNALAGSREELYEGVPEICTVTIPASGDLSEQQISLVTTPCLRAPVYMELTIANLEYFKLALDEKFEELPEAHDSSDPVKKRELVSNHTHTSKIYKTTQGEKVTLFTSVKDPTNKKKYKRLQQTIRLSDDPEFNQKAEQLAIDEVDQKAFALADLLADAEEESDKNEEETPP